MKKPQILFTLLSYLALSVPIIFSSENAFSFGTPKHSKIAVTSKPTKDGQINFQFKVVPNDDMKITFDAPWEFTLKDHEGLKFKKTKLKVKDLNQKIPGFELVTQSISKAKGTLSYKLIAFICTKDKTRCFREVHKVQADWSK